MGDDRNILSALPSIDQLLATPGAERLAAEVGRKRVRDLLRGVTDQLRGEITSGHALAFGTSRDELMTEVESRLHTRALKLSEPSLRRVINATGVIVHTNLGRAPLAAAAIDAITQIGTGYSNLEYDLGRGERGAREAHCQEILANLTGSEAAVVVNNNAAAVLLTLNTLAQDGEVIVSRGELVEIGGSFRIPEIMEKSGARLREVGTTNRTRIADYEEAINERTRLILRVHPSNYRIIGFTERASLAEIVALCRRRAIPSFEDLGSGCLIDLSPYGVGDEPVVSTSIEAGIDVVSFSGDKMLGGPQAGIIAGSGEVVGRIKKNPLMRALRVDKVTYAALEATLALYQRESAETDVPVLRALSMRAEEIRGRAQAMAEYLMQGKGAGAVSQNGHRGLKVAVEPGTSIIGGGSAPGARLKTFVLAIQSDGKSAEDVSSALRARPIPVITRTESDRVLVDLRTVSPDEDSIVANELAAVLDDTIAAD